MKWAICNNTDGIVLSDETKGCLNGYHGKTCTTNSLIFGPNIWTPPCRLATMDLNDQKLSMLNFSAAEN